MTRTSLPTILIACLAGAAAGALMVVLVPSDSLESPVAAASEDARVAKLEKDNQQLQRAIDELRSSQALLASRTDRSSVASPVESAAAVVGVEPTDVAPVVVAPTEMTLESALAQLSDPELSYNERTEIWERAHKAGILDPLMEAMADRAAREPNNPDLRVDLGNAYLQKLMRSNLVEQGKWAMKADSSFDTALTLDPQHWEARFTKAVSYTHWPAITGKPGLAIGEFQTLIAQQNAGPKKPHHAMAYLYLGNMHESAGDLAKAKEVWAQGASMFPDNAALQAQMASK